MEEYKEILEFPNYQISNFGNVINIKKNKQMHPYLKKSGYVVIRLSNKGQAVECKIHRLVAIAFITNPDNLPFVNHKDENKSNNHYTNLEWCNSTYNNNYGTRSERQAKKIQKPVKQYSINNVFIKKYSSIQEAGKSTNNNPNNISNCLRTKAKTSGGYIWKYAKFET